MNALIIFWLFAEVREWVGDCLKRELSLYNSDIDINYSCDVILNYI